MKVNGISVNRNLDEIYLGSNYLDVMKAFGIEMYFPDRNPDKEKWIKVKGTKFLDYLAEYEFLFDNSKLNEIRILLFPEENNLTSAAILRNEIERRMKLSDFSDKSQQLSNIYKTAECTIKLLLEDPENLVYIKIN